MSPDLFPNRERSEVEQQPPATREVRFEVPVSVEKKKEETPTVHEGGQHTESEYARLTAPVPTPHATATLPQTHKAESLLQVEGVLEDHIADLYARIPDHDKARFKEKGEEIARQIDTLLQQAKVQVKKIIFLIASWLKLIPGVNKFFIEQEALMKTEQLLKLRGKRE